MDRRLSSQKTARGWGRERGKVPSLSPSSFLLPFFSPLSISRHPRLSGCLEKARWVKLLSKIFQDTQAISLTFT